MPNKDKLSDQGKAGRRATVWFRRHTLADLRGLASELEDEGENVRKLLEAVDQLESLYAEAFPEERKGKAIV